ncbi:MAG: ImmA/IrrE family metallo-endopeptidase [Fimbriimonadaceae bacterium]|nr:ImmA/IrrE family metallo-endopeptidase [Fimbriimonadaceae bacterium]
MDVVQPPDEGVLAGLGERLRIRRDAVGLSVRKLAEQLGASRNTITNYEQGHTVPSTSDLVRLAAALGCTLVDLLDLPASQPPARFAFRAHKALQSNPDVAVMAQKYLRAYADIEEICDARLPRRLRRAPVATAGPNLDLRIAATAERVREDSGFAELGPTNIVQALENLGVRCIFFQHPTPGLDGISVEQDEMSLVLLPDRAQVVERVIFSAAHELGHLVLHPELFTAAAQKVDDARDYEHEAHVFAASFLVPEGDLLRTWQDERLARLPLERALLVLKWRFQVSFWALFERVRGLGLTETTYPALTTSVKRLLGFEGRASRQDLEPQPLPAGALYRSTRFERLVYSAFVQEEIGVAKVAELLQLTVDDARRRTAEWIRPRAELVG